MAYGSAREADYEISSAHRLGFLRDTYYEKIALQAAKTCKVLNGLIRSSRTQRCVEKKNRRK